MQNTRLNNLVDFLWTRLGLWFANPWRRLSMILISFLFGFLVGQALCTTAGTGQEWILSGMLIIFTEAVNRLIYSGKFPKGKSNQTVDRASWLADVVNSFKIGLVYSMYLEAFKLGS